MASEILRQVRGYCLAIFISISIPLWLSVEGSRLWLTILMLLFGTVFVLIKQFPIGTIYEATQGKPPSHARLRIVIEILNFPAHATAKFAIVLAATAIAVASFGVTPSWLHNTEIVVIISVWSGHLISYLFKSTCSELEIEEEEKQRIEL